MRESIFDDPPVTPFVECPNCKRLLAYGTDRCPDCYEEIREDYARLSGAVVIVNTQACAMANTIRTLDITAVLALGVAVFTYVVDEGPTLALTAISWPGLALAAVVVWFVRFGRFKFGDQDFVRARQQMLLRLAGWTILTGTLWAFYFVVIRAVHTKT